MKAPTLRPSLRAPTTLLRSHPPRRLLSAHPPSPPPNLQPTPPQHPNPSPTPQHLSNPTQPTPPSPASPRPPRVSSPPQSAGHTSSFYMLLLGGAILSVPPITWLYWDHRNAHMTAVRQEKLAAIRAKYQAQQPS